MVADTTSIKCVTFADMVSIVANRGQIAGNVQDRDLNFIKGSLNEHNQRISSERSWSWRKMDRDYVFQVAISTGTVSVTNNSRSIVFTGLTLDNTYLHKSFKVIGTTTLYRIIGLDLGANTAFISAPYVDSTNATATYKIFSYEMPLPPDCDEITQIYYDYPIFGYPDGKNLDFCDNLQFNRILGSNIDLKALPVYYTRDGKISAETLPPLDVMVLNYDFLGGELYDQVDRLRLFPIDPDISRVLHINYTLKVDIMSADTDEPLMNVDDRWVLVNFALADWFASRGQKDDAAFALSKAVSKLKEMRNQQQSTDPAPKLKNSLTKYRRRRSFYNSNLDLLRLSRDLDQ